MNLKKLKHKTLTQCDMDANMRMTMVTTIALLVLRTGELKMDMDCYFLMCTRYTLGLKLPCVPAS